MSVGAKRFVRNRMAVVSVVLLAGFVLVACFASEVAPYSYKQQQLSETYRRPSQSHWFGTDALGRDLFSRLIYGSRVSMGVSVVTVAVVLLLGVPAGLASGYYGGRVDFVVMRVVDIGYAFPGLLMMIVVSAYLGSALPNIHSGPLLILKEIHLATGGVVAVVIALVIFGWLNLARLVRGQVLGLRHRDYIEAVRALGASDWRIMCRHLLPNSLGTVIVATAILIPEFIIAEAGLSFIGLGVKPPTPSWGIMLSEGVEALRSHPHVALEPGLAIALLLLALNFLGDGLRDALDPLTDSTAV